MKGSCTLVASVLAASTVALGSSSSSAGDRDSLFHPCSNEVQLQFSNLKKKRNFKIFNTNSDSFRCSLKYSVCCFVYLFSFLMNFVFAIVICLRIKIRDFAFIVFKNPFLLMGFICLSFRFENFNEVTTF